MDQAPKLFLDALAALNISDPVEIPALGNQDFCARPGHPARGRTLSVATRYLQWQLDHLKQTLTAYGTSDMDTRGTPWFLSLLHGGAQAASWDQTSCPGQTHPNGPRQLEGLVTRELPGGLGQEQERRWFVVTFTGLDLGPVSPQQETTLCPGLGPSPGSGRAHFEPD